MSDGRLGSPHLRSFSPTQACPAGDFWGYVFGEAYVKRPVFSLSFVQREVQGRDWKLTRAWPSCWGRSAKREARLPSAHIPLTQSLLSLGIIGGTLSLGFSLSKSQHFPRPNSRPCSLMMPCWAPSPPWTPLAYVLIQTAPRSSFTHGCCTSLLLSTGMENSRRWRLS